jgi:hypothetical protein
MTSEITNINLTHERDAAWLIALYLAVHGGDPAPRQGEVITRELQVGGALSAIAVLSEALDEKARDAVLNVLAPLQKQYPMKSVEAQVAAQRLAAMGIHLTQYAGEYAGEQATAANIAEGSRPSNADERFQRTRFYCFIFRGDSFCWQIPSPDPIPFA